jgi:hypothetical protein
LHKLGGYAHDFLALLGGRLLVRRRIPLLPGRRLLREPGGRNPANQHYNKNKTDWTQKSGHRYSSISMSEHLGSEHLGSEHLGASGSI